jgi:hypothetical protein
MEFTKWFNLVAAALNCVIIYYADVVIEPFLIFITIMNFGVFFELSLRPASA